MKKILLSFTLFMVAIMSHGTQVILDGTSSSTDVAAGTTLTLNAQTCYLLKGCYDVKGTIVIPAGTVIYGDYNTPSSALIIHRGGKIFANGTSTSPVIFTSSRNAGSRQAGDWGGIVIAGNAYSNVGQFQAEGGCEPVLAGSSDPANCSDNSGSMTYVQIHYAGQNKAGSPAGNEINSLTLAAVGSGTTIHHIQVTNANDDAFEWFGGSVNTKYLISWRTRDDDFDTDFGHTGKHQFGLALRDSSIHDVSGSNGFESDNNNTSGFAGTPETRPIFVNYSLFGPLACYPNADSTSLHPDYKGNAGGAAIYLRRNTHLSTYNSLIAGWGKGLFLTDAPTIANTAVTNTGICNTGGQLNFSYNAWAANKRNFQHNTGWAASSGCESTMALWLNGGTAGCKETGNSNIGNFAAIGTDIGCGEDYCDEEFYLQGPDFSVSNSTLLSYGVDWNHADLNPGVGGFFDEVAFAGAFGNTDWSDGWTNWCPNSFPGNCSAQAPRMGSIEEATGVSRLSVYPNPVSGATQVAFSLNEAAEVEISILNINGIEVKKIAKGTYAVGDNSVSFDASDLRAGNYLVKIQNEKGVQTIKFVK